MCKECKAKHAEWFADGGGGYDPYATGELETCSHAKTLAFEIGQTKVLEQLEKIVRTFQWEPARSVGGKRWEAAINAMVAIGGQGAALVPCEEGCGAYVVIGAGGCEPGTNTVRLYSSEHGANDSVEVPV